MLKIIGAILVIGFCVVLPIQRILKESTEIRNNKKRIDVKSLFNNLLIWLTPLLIIIAIFAVFHIINEVCDDNVADVILSMLFTASSLINVFIMGCIILTPILLLFKHIFKKRNKHKEEKK